MQAETPATFDKRAFDEHRACISSITHAWVAGVANANPDEAGLSRRQAEGVRKSVRRILRSLWPEPGVLTHLDSVDLPVQAWFHLQREPNGVSVRLIPRKSWQANFWVRVVALLGESNPDAPLPCLRTSLSRQRQGTTLQSHSVPARHGQPPGC